MLIILEGSDCAGKTTLADDLEKRLRHNDPDAEVMRLSSGPPQLHLLDEYVVPLLGYQPGSGTHVIVDRLHWGEAVYPQIFDRESTLDLALWHYIEAFLESRGAIMILVHSSLDVVRERIERRGDDLVNAGQILAIQGGFIAAASSSRLSCMQIDTRFGNDHALSAIIDYAQAHETAVEPLSKFVTYVGPIRPKRLLLGDVRGPAFQTDDPIDQLRPAFMPYRSMSGAYLWKTLTRETLTTREDVEQTGVANACDVDDPYDLWHVLGEPQVTVLGQNAERAFKRYAVAAPHPQWVRRFHHNRIDDYRDQLVEGKAVQWN